MKYLIFDSGPIISFTMNGLLDVFEKLKKIFPGEFIITPQVKRELVDKPLRIKRYELEALKVQDLIERGILKMSSTIVPNNLLEKETFRILGIANNSFQANERINLIQTGEASCLAFANLCKCENVIVIDERTTRMLTESPENLKNIMENKLHTKIKVSQDNLKRLRDFKFIRSPELAYIAYTKNLFTLKEDKTLLDAILYGLKFKGAAISSDEIERMKRLAQK